MRDFIQYLSFILVVPTLSYRVDSVNYDFKEELEN